MCDEPITPPNGEAAVRRTYGDIHVDLRTEQVISPISWEAVNLVRVEVPGLPRPIRVHKLIVPALTAAMARYMATGNPWRPRVVGCWAVRKRRGGNSLSVHCWAIALDFDPDQNPRGLRDTTLPQQFIDAFLAEGWTWGGNFQTPDPQHMQLCSGF